MKLAVVVSMIAALTACGNKSEKVPKQDVVATPPVAAAHDAAPARPPAPPEKDPLTPAQLAQYQQELRAGQKLEKQKKYTEAIAAFERALAIKPNDARAGSELGWAAFEAGDLERSISASRASVAAAADRQLKAASLYNLGRALEQRGDKDGAGEAYNESFALRPNAIVQKRLASIGAASPSSLVAPTPVPGPFASIEAYCKAWLAKQPIPPDHDPSYGGWECGVDVRTDTAPGEVTAGKPFEKLVVFAEENDYAWTYRIAMKTRAGWFIGPPTWTREANTDDGSIDRLVVGSADSAGNGIVSIEWSYNYNERDREADESPYANSKYLVVCGANQAGKVSCTPTFEVDFDRGGDNVKAEQWTVKAALTAGSIELSSGDRGVAAHMKSLFGKHPLVFP